ncbi:hypothetical protein [Chryseobacterium balustinum]|uniref:hypothetical protein n=1 Tax=Chryseobacterium balustinum TaxID=246 RepID=UPI000F50AC79|nr:hypothetical protein [Chryseobacterium balustinum]AZB28413.1 hypothetical protein EB354_03560 [Chryseobacterium balustinum]
MINYAVNYEYIVENLCENKAKPELMCNGKCYVSKELTKTNQEQTTQNGHKISVPSIDVFWLPKILNLLTRTSIVFIKNLSVLSVRILIIPNTIQRYFIHL